MAATDHGGATLSSSDDPQSQTVPLSRALPPRPRPGRPKRGNHAYTWTAVIITMVGSAAVLAAAVGWFSLPMDPLGSGAWFVVTAVMLISPFTVVVGVCAWGVLALYRLTGLRYWPSSLQALLASMTMFAVLGLVLVALFTEYE